MKKGNWYDYRLAFMFFFILLQLSCAKSEMNGGRGEVIDYPEETPANEVPDMEERPDTLPHGVYDIDDEMKREQQDNKDILQRGIEPMERDTFTVKKVSEHKVKTNEYDVGFRVQVFATSELSKARAIKKKVVSQLGLDAYIEYEDELYKVRVGNYNNRKKAEAARLSIIDLYPECWIVRTTIKK